MSVQEIVLIAGMVAVTFGARYVPLALAERLRMPRIVEAALRFVPVAVLTAITVPAVLMPKGTLAVEVGNPYLFGGLAAVVVAWLSKRLLPTLAAGIAVFVFWKLVVLA
jgi:branched-subunit amino acid transport protein